jgi:hypothetical protein
MIGLLDLIPIPGIYGVSFMLRLLLRVLSFFFRLFAGPLKISLIARDSTGRVTLFMITDGRNCLARSMGIDSLGKMELMRLDSKKNPRTLMITRNTRTFDCCSCSGYCCVHWFLQSNHVVRA